MAVFKKFRRVGFSEMRPVTIDEIKGGVTLLTNNGISISQVDIDEGSPKEGDMIARNPEDHIDQWLVAKKYFDDNFVEN